MSYLIEEVSWTTHREALTTIRKTVFVDEQKVPLDLELDEHDETCTHVLARWKTGKPVGTARMLANGHIGRMAVLAPYRKQGVASELLKFLVGIARSRGLHQVFLHAQLAAVGFYEKHGFSPFGEEFMDAGIPHIAMNLTLSE